MTEQLAMVVHHSDAHARGVALLLLLLLLVLLLRGTIRYTQKNYIFPYFYYQYLVLITMAPRNRRGCRAVLCSVHVVECLLEFLGRGSAKKHKRSGMLAMGR